DADDVDLGVLEVELTGPRQLDGQTPAEGVTGSDARQQAGVTLAQAANGEIAVLQAQAAQGVEVTAGHPVGGRQADGGEVPVGIDAGQIQLAVVDGGAELQFGGEDAPAMSPQVPASMNLQETGLVEAALVDVGNAGLDADVPGPVRGLGGGRKSQQGTEYKGDPDGARESSVDH